MYARQQALRQQRDPDMARRQKERDRAQFQTPGFDRQFGRYTQLSNGAEGRMAGQGFRDAQGDLLRQLQADAAGKGPSQELVRMQAQGMADRGYGQQLAAAGAARPGQGALASRNAAFAGAGLQSQVGGQAAQAGLQARLGAMQQIGQVAGQARQGDLSQMGLNDQTQLEALRQRLQLSGMQQGGSADFMKFLEAQRQYNQSQPSDWERWLKGGTDLVGAGAQIYGMSQGKPPTPKKQPGT